MRVRAPERLVAVARPDRDADARPARDSELRQERPVRRADRLRQREHCIFRRSGGQWVLVVEIVEIEW